MAEGATSPDRRGKKRKASIVDVLVRDYADEWEKWDAYLQREEVDAESRGEVWEHLRGYKKKLDTYSMKERRKAFRAMYRRYRPMLQSGSLSFATSVGSEEGSPLMLPQLETDLPQLPMLSFDEQFRTTDAAVDAATTSVLAIVTGCVCQERMEKEVPCDIPEYLTIHQRYKSGTDAVSVALFENFNNCEKHDHNFQALRNIIDTDLNALANSTGGNIIIGVSNKAIVQGYPLSRKIRDQIRLAVDNQMHKWKPVPTMMRLVKVKFIEVRSHAKMPIHGHFVIWIYTKQAPTVMRNSKGEVVKGLKYTTKLWKKER